MMNARPITIALVRDVFHQPDGPKRLRARLAQARDRGADLAVLPELPLNPWSPATKNARDEDAEPPQGPRHEAQAQAAADAGVGLVGGVIVQDQGSGVRRNTALVFDASGALVASFCKIHIPEEPGFWETSHYEAGETPSPVIEQFDFPFGLQICSDINRPEGCHLLGALGAMAVLAPRATERIKADRWRLVFRAGALTSGLYILSVDRPGPEQGVELGGPTVVAAPDGSVLLDTDDSIGVVTLDPGVVEQARVDYPGYLPVRADIYAEAWRRVAQTPVAG